MTALSCAPETMLEEEDASDPSLDECSGDEDDRKVLGEGILVRSVNSPSTTFVSCVSFSASLCFAYSIMAPLALLSNAF